MDANTYFETVAPEWETMRSGFFAPSVREKAIAAAGLEPPGRVADIGAGSGFVTEALAAGGFSVTAVDRSASMLKALSARLSGVDCRQGDAEALPLETGEVAAAFANMYLHHVDDPAAALREMARIIRPDGRLVITDLDEHAHAFLAEEHHDRWMGFDRRDIDRWFRQAGLVDVAVVCANENCCATAVDGTEAAKVSIFIASGRKPV